ncbi:MAG TPA: DUF2892 domain-containing protein [Symbiobacteriaceae bacterium]|nr:DUF2892 domain-containing protein [Symbiobacteriaceae bacterium]
MDQNIGLTDRYIRITLGSLFMAVGAARMVRNVDAAGVAAGLFGGMMLAEGFLGTCPLYSLMGMNTNDDPAPGTRTNDVIEPYEGI